jgi:anti-anti-sigma regulatory factor
MSGDPQQIAFGAAAGQFYLGFEGGATHRASCTADRITGQFLAAVSAQPAIVLDLDGCSWIDSTFAGWMIRLQKQVLRSGGKLVVSRCPDGCRSSLDVMGLAPLFEFSAVAAPATLTRLQCADEELDAATIEFMAEAHESLGKVDSPQAAAFTHIAEQLRHELDRGGQ